MALRRTQLENGAWMRWLAMICILLALVMTGVEATHAHSDAAVSPNSRPCAICISAHTNAPAATFQPLPVLYAIDVVAIPFRTEGKSTAPELSLFIRPPPSA
jgi:hypothetical protein